MGLDAGLHHVYLGNVDESEGEDTLCPSCGATAVRRRGYTVLERSTKHGACARCGTPLGIVE
jgi:pyruvate formate lyase activating enzyme